MSVNVSSSIVRSSSSSSTKYRTSSSHVRLLTVALWSSDHFKRLNDVRLWAEKR